MSIRQTDSISITLLRAHFLKNFSADEIFFPSSILAWLFHLRFCSGLGMDGLLLLIAIADGRA